MEDVSPDFKTPISQRETRAFVYFISEALMKKPISYRIDRIMKTVFVKVTGQISIEDLIEQEKKIIKDSGFEKGFNTYADFSEAKPSHNVTFDKVKMSKEFVESIQDMRGKCKWAIYAPYDYPYAFAKMFAVLSRDLIIETRVFREEEKAKAWLGITDSK